MRFSLSTFFAIHILLIHLNTLVDLIGTIIGYIFMGICYAFGVLYFGGMLYFILIQPIVEAISEHWSRLDCPKCNKKRVGTVARKYDSSSVNGIKYTLTTTCKNCGYIIKTEESETPLSERKKPKRTRTKSYSRSSNPKNTLTTAKPHTTNSIAQGTQISTSGKAVVGNSSSYTPSNTYNPTRSYNGGESNAPPLSTPPITKKRIDYSPLLLEHLVDKNNAWINREIETTARPQIPETEIVLLHKQIQREISYCLLRSNVPERLIYNEFRGIDILVDDPMCFTLIEIKSGPNVMMNIREAVGQLLEYQYFTRWEIQGRENPLVIVSPAEASNEVSEYMRYIRFVYKMNVTYKQYVPGSFSFGL